VSAYLDSSVVVSLFLGDIFSQRADELVASEKALLVADWAVVEVSSVIAKQARTGAISPAEAQTLYSNFDSWRASLAAAETTPADMLAAAQFVRRADLALRGPDALHIAICARRGAKLLTFDLRLAAAAQALGVEAAP
jgi:uncharacterized protein